MKWSELGLDIETLIVGQSNETLLGSIQVKWNSNDFMAPFISHRRVELDGNLPEFMADVSVKSDWRKVAMINMIWYWILAGPVKIQGCIYDVGAPPFSHRWRPILAKLKLEHGKLKRQIQCLEFWLHSWCNCIQLQPFTGLNRLINIVNR